MQRPTPDILAGMVQGDEDAVGLAIGPQVMALNISAVRLDGGTQPRAGINQAVVDDYASDMDANGAEFPPVQVVYDGSDYWLWDGFHRLHARKRNGLHTVPAIVRQGTRRDAVLLSVGANATHGFRRTNEDKRRAVMALLHDEEWRQWSDREIARRCAVSNQLVSNVRSELSVNDGQIETRRVVRNGTEYTMTTPQRTPAPAVAAQGTNYVTPTELTAALQEWSGAFEDTGEALRGLLADFRALGSGDYKSDWEEWMDRRWYMQDMLICLGDLLRPAVQSLTPLPVEELEEALLALDGVSLPGVDEDWLFDYMTDFVKRDGYSITRPVFDMAMRLAMPRQIAALQRQDRLERAQAAAMAADAERAPLGRQMVFETKRLNQGKTVKLYGRNVDGTLTVTVDASTVHLYSPGMTMTRNDAFTLTRMIKTAQQELFDPKEMSNA